MKYIPIVGLTLAAWGLLTLDWMKVGFGVFMFLGAFAIDTFKKRAVLKDDKLFTAHRALTELIRIVRRSFDATEIDTSSPKADLAQGLFYLGMVDAASQSAGMTDRQFLDLFQATFHDLDFGEEFSSRILLFHQSLQTSHPAFPAVMQGGDVYMKFINGNNTIPLASGTLIADFVRNPKFPNSVDGL